MRMLGILGLVSNGLFGAFDLVLVYLREPVYLSVSAGILRIPLLELIRYYDAWPMWANAGWSLNVWAGVAGSILLFIRDRFAVYFLILSLFGFSVLSYFFHLAPFPRVAGDEIAHWGEFVRTAASMTCLLHGLFSIWLIARSRPTMQLR